MNTVVQVRGVFYGWIVVAAVFAITFVGFGSAYTFSAFVQPLQHEFGASRGSVSLVFALSGFLYFSFGIISGRLADRWGARRLAVIGMTLIGSGLALASVARTLIEVYLAYGLGVGLGIGCAYVPVVGVVQRWFDKRRGLASGLARGRSHRAHGIPVWQRIWSQLPSQLALWLLNKFTFIIQASRLEFAPMRERTDRANAAGSMSLNQLGGDFGSAAHLQRWLLDCAYPRWWSDGVDRTHGGFHERLQQNAAPTAEPRRARLHPRQMYAFSCADDLGHDGLTDPAVRHGLDYFLRYYVRDDGFIRACVTPDGRVIDDAAILYDQAFALLGFAAAFDVLADELLRDRARGLLANIQRRMTNPAGGFFESAEYATLLTSNAHMHLFEAALAWMAVDHDPRWQTLAERIVELALARFADPDTRQIREFFTPDWNVAPGEAGHIVEPGHQFEWAWLLLRWHASTRDQRAADLALTLIHQAETRGVDVNRGVAMNSLLVDGTVRDARARLWPQTERLKAACIAWETTRLDDYRSMAQLAATSLTRYLETPTPGLWYDTVDLAGQFIDEPAPASSFYHLVAAITELSGTVNRISGRQAAVHSGASGQPVAVNDRLPRSPR